MAICPSQSIIVDSLDYSWDFFAAPEGSVAEMPFLEMIKTCRAIRVFKDKPVPKGLLDKIVEAITYAPPGFTPIKTEVVVEQDTEVIRQALPEMIKVYDYLINAMNHPVFRFIIHRKVGDAKFNILAQHMETFMKSRLPEVKQGTRGYHYSLCTGNARFSCTPGCCELRDRYLYCVDLWFPGSTCVRSRRNSNRSDSTGDSA